MNLFRFVTRFTRRTGSGTLASDSDDRPATIADSPAADDASGPASAFLERGHLPEALEAVDAALMGMPDDAPLLLCRAKILAQWSRYREANTHYTYALASSSDPAAFTAAGWCSYLQGDMRSALAFHERALELAPTADALFGFAITLQAYGKHDEAIRTLRKVADIDPAYRDVWLNVGISQRSSGDNASAEQSFRRALSENPRDSHAWMLLALSLGSQAKTEESFNAFQQSRELDRTGGAPVGCLAQLVVALVIHGRFEEAVETCKQDLPKQPDPFAHYLYGWALLTTGQHRLGWPQYEFRWLRDPLRSDRIELGVPRWSGQNVAGKTVLLWAEQGFGDTFQFARFAQIFKKLGAVVVLKVREGLRDLAGKFHGVDRVVTESPGSGDIDYHIPLMSIPAALGMEEADIPAAVPYLEVDTALAARWESQLASVPGLRVGLVWAGNSQRGRDEERSIDLASFGSLWKIGGIQFVSLQKDLRAGDQDKLPTAPLLVNAGPSLETFSETAALISTLDLVISVDTAVAHLAGVLGKPVWLLSSKIPDFRWMEDRLTSPWYPTMRIFREATEGDWDELILRVTSELAVARDARDHLIPPLGPAKAESGSEVTSERAPSSSASLRPQVCLVTDARDGVFQFLPDEDDEARSIAFYGEYLSEELDLLAGLLRRDASVLEYWSGVGSHTIWLARHLSRDAQIFCYEPRAVIRRILGNNLRNNGEPSVTFPRGTLAGPNLAPNTRDGDADPSYTIDGLKLARLDLLKLNDPSSSIALLEGAGKTMWARRPILMLRTRDVDSDRTITNMASAHAYRCWKVSVPLHRPNNFNRRDHDIFLGRASSAVLGIPEEHSVNVPVHLQEISR